MQRRRLAAVSRANGVVRRQTLRHHTLRQTGGWSGPLGGLFVVIAGVSGLLFVGPVAGWFVGAGAGPLVTGRQIVEGIGVRASDGGRLVGRQTCLRPLLP